jgi:hypothetical protein
MEYIIFYFEKYNTYYPFRFVLQTFSHQVKKNLPSNIQIALVRGFQLPQPFPKLIQFRRRRLARHLSCEP